MGMPVQSVSLFLTEHARDPFAGPALSYGVQNMNLPFEGAVWIFERLGITPDPAGLTDPPIAPIPVDFARIIRMLGLGKLALLDVSDYEHADLVADLNYPVPEEMHGTFGLILDGGTMEHVFDIRQGMKNTADLLRPGGRVVHITPCNNYVNHGFVQISPTLYHDYYIANGFEDVRGVLVVHPRDEVFTQKWNLVNYDHDLMGSPNSMYCEENTQLAIYFTARKTATSTSDKVPMQSYFERLHSGKRPPGYMFTIKHDESNPIFESIVSPQTPIPREIGDIVNI